MTKEVLCLEVGVIPTYVKDTHLTSYSLFFFPFLSLEKLDHGMRKVFPHFFPAFPPSVRVCRGRVGSVRDLFW